jgi:hypothetical protein
MDQHTTKIVKDQTLEMEEEYWWEIGIESEGAVSSVVGSFWEMYLQVVIWNFNLKIITASKASNMSKFFQKFIVIIKMYFRCFFKILKFFVSVRVVTWLGKRLG